MLSYVRVDDAEKEQKECCRSNLYGPTILAEACSNYDVKFLSFSTDLVFDGQKPYTEMDAVAPLNNYGKSKAEAEKEISILNSKALIVRTSSLFWPWDQFNFAFTTLKSLKEHQRVRAASDVFVSSTYVPDLVNECLDLLLDNESGIFHITNFNALSWSEFAVKIAVMAGYDASLIEPVNIANMKLKATRPSYSVLKSKKGIIMPSIDNALYRFFENIDPIYLSNRIAG